MPAELLRPFEHGRSVIRGELDEETRARLLELRERAPEAAPRRQGDRVLERPRARRARRGARGGSSGRTCSPRRSRVGEFLLGPLSDERRPAPAQLPRGPGAQRRLPRRLRERRARAARAPRRDRRAALARARRTGSRGSRSSSSATTSAAASSSRPRDGEQLVAREEGPRRQPAAVRQLDARARAAPARADLRRRRARAARRSASCGSILPTLERAPGAFGWALCALDLHLSPPRELAIVGPPDARRRPRRARALPAAHRRRVRPRRGRAAARRARRSSTDGPPYTSASASPAVRRSPIRPPCPPRKELHEHDHARAQHRSRGRLLGSDRHLSRARRPRARRPTSRTRARPRRRFRERYAGRIAELDAPGLAEAVAELERIDGIATRVRAYAYLHFSTNTADPARGALLQRTQEHEAALETELLFFRLEWTELEDERAEALLADESLATYRYFLASLRRYRPVPALGARGADPDREVGHRRVGVGAALRRAADRGARARSTARRPRSSRRSRGSTRPSARCAAAPPTRSPRASRRASARARTSSTRSCTTRRPTTGCAATSTGSQARNLSNDTPDETVEALVDAVTGRYDIPQRYYRLKAKLLGIDRLAHYDRMAPVSQTTSDVPWGEAVSLVQDSYASFSEEAGRIVTDFFARSWVDAPIRPDKHVGAYCMTRVPGVHPYVLMNYTGDRRSVLTLAHELGHGLHGVLAQDRGVFNSETPLTLAETASVFGEALTFKNLVAAEQDPARRLDLLIGRIDDAVATDVPPDRAQPLRGRRAHRAARRGRARGRPLLRALDGGAGRPHRRLGRPRRLRELVELHPPLRRHARLRLRVRVRLPVLARDLPGAGSARATRSSSRTSTCCARAGRSRRSSWRGSSGSTSATARCGRTGSRRSTSCWRRRRSSLGPT